MAKTIDLLKEIARRSTPFAIEPGADLDTLLFLRAAGWVEAQMPKGRDQPVMVRDITFAGRAVLEQVERNS